MEMDLDLDVGDWILGWLGVEHGLNIGWTGLLNMKDHHQGIIIMEAHHLFCQSRAFARLGCLVVEQIGTQIHNIHESIVLKSL